LESGRLLSGETGAIIVLRATRILTRAGRFVLIAVISLWGVDAMAIDGLVTMRSDRGPAETMNRLEAAVKENGLTVFARIDHAAGAKEVGLPLRPTAVLIFGNAKGGMPLMQSVQTIGIDLPLKVLVWEDVSDVTWLSYNDPSWLAKRHGLSHGSDAVASALAAALGAIVKMAARQ
jgi:uncharacterized protein (DUF302 family)